MAPSISPAPQASAGEAVPEDQDLPIARVHGQPFSQIPRDLYIPPDALEVLLETFEGPLDLLLYLIKRHNLDILDIPIAEITRQYLGYLKAMEILQLELAAEYLVMAAWLAEIKSRLLLPRPKPDGDEEAIDPRAELVRRLQEYERFKNAAADLDALPRLERDVFAATAALPARRNRPPPPVTLEELLQALDTVLQRADLHGQHHIQGEALSVRERMGELLERVDPVQFCEFKTLLQTAEGRRGVVVTFLACLELIREGLLELVQNEPFGPIHLRLATPQ
ncbi:MAG: segregation and condensation protein A [Candidatus Competibacterales bacterium]